MLPSGFVRVGHFGFLAHRVRRAKVAPCRELLGRESAGSPAPLPVAAAPGRTSPTARTWPACGHGRMVPIPVLPPVRPGVPSREAAVFDSS